MSGRGCVTHRPILYYAWVNNPFRNCLIKRKCYVSWLILSSSNVGFLFLLQNIATNMSFSHTRNITYLTHYELCFFFLNLKSLLKRRDIWWRTRKGITGSFAKWSGHRRVINTITITRLYFILYKWFHIAWCIFIKPEICFDYDGWTWLIWTYFKLFYPVPWFLMQM